MVWAILKTFTTAIALGNIVTVWLLMRRARQMRQTLQLLQTICFNAFMMRQWPFELSRAMCLRVDIRPEPDMETIWGEFERMQR